MRVKTSQSESHFRIEYVPLSSLKPAKRNPKRHAVETVLESERRFGFVSPPVLDERTGLLAAGHGRLDALRRAKAKGLDPPHNIRVSNGDWLVPVARGVAFANDHEAEAYLLADNQTTILGGWDDRELMEII